MWSSILHSIDVEKVVAALPEQGKYFLQARSMAAVVGGGFIRDVVAGVVPRDVDLFCGAELVKRPVKRPNGEAIPPLDIVLIEYPIMRNIIHMFDFTISCAVVGWNKDRWISKCHERFYQDIEQKRLFIDTNGRENNETFLAALGRCSGRRIARMLELGYRIDRENFIRVFGLVKREQRSLKDYHPTIAEAMMEGEESPGSVRASGWGFVQTPPMPEVTVEAPPGFRYQYIRFSDGTNARVSDSGETTNEPTNNR